jgi:hypothetical protein
MISLRSTCLSCALLALSAVPAFCTPVFFTDRPTWLTAVTAPSTVTFDTAFGDYNTAAGYSTGLVLPDGPTFVGSLLVNGVPGYSLTIVDPALNPTYWNYGSGGSLAWSTMSGLTTSSVLHVTWATPVTAFAVDLMTYTGGVSYTAKLNSDSGQVYSSNATPGYPNHTFFGLTSVIPITSVDFYLPPTSGEVPRLDNFAYGTAASDPGQVPEAATSLLIASGMIGMALIGRRSRRPASQPESA